MVGRIFKRKHQRAASTSPPRKQPKSKRGRQDLGKEPRARSASPACDVNLYSISANYVDPKSGKGHENFLNYHWTKQKESKMFRLKR